MRNQRARMKTYEQATRLRIKQPTKPFLHVAVDHFALSLPVRVHYTNNRYPVRPRLVHLVSTPRAVQRLDVRILQLRTSWHEYTDLVVEEQKHRARLHDSLREGFLRYLLYNNEANQTEEQGQW